jgi:hypothetical protein
MKMLAQENIKHLTIDCIKATGSPRVTMFHDQLSKQKSLSQIDGALHQLNSSAKVEKNLSQAKANYVVCFLSLGCVSVLYENLFPSKASVFSEHG